MKLFGKKQTYGERMVLISAEVQKVLGDHGWKKLSSKEYNELVTEECGHRRDKMNIVFVHAMYFQKGGKVLAVSPILMNDKNDFFGHHEYVLGGSPKIAIPNCEVIVLTNHYQFWHGPFPYAFNADVHLVNFARPQQWEEISAFDVVFAISAYLTARGY